MLKLFAFLPMAAVHSLASIGIGMTVLFLLDGYRSPLEDWQSYADLLRFNIMRYPHGYFVATALACMMLVPMRAAFDDAYRAELPWGIYLARTLGVAVLAPVTYWIALIRLRTAYFGDMTIYARVNAGGFMLIALALWAAVSVPITLTTSRLIKSMVWQTRFACRRKQR